MTTPPKTMAKIRDAEAEKYYKESGFAPTEWAVMNFKAGFDCRDKLDNEALRIAVETLELIHKNVGSIPFSNNDKWGRSLELVYGKSSVALAEIRKLRPES